MTTVVPPAVLPVTTSRLVTAGAGLSLKVAPTTTRPVMLLVMESVIIAVSALALESVPAM
jgi:hypothetical protein